MNKQSTGHGGSRPGSGRKKTLPEGVRVRPIKVTDQEYEQIKLFIQKLRSND